MQGVNKISVHVGAIMKNIWSKELACASISPTDKVSLSPY